MSLAEVLIPRLNANDDELLVVDVRVSEGDLVAKGDVLFVVESMKASNEIEAPDAGIIQRIGVRKGEMASVGKLMCAMIEPGSVAGLEQPGTVPTRSSTEKVKITAKASQRARELGIDITDVTPSNGQIGLKEVEAFAERVTA